MGAMRSAHCGNSAFNNVLITTITNSEVSDIKIVRI